MDKPKPGFSLREKIDEQLRRVTDSCLRIGSIQDNLLSYFASSVTALDNPNVAECSYQLMEMERSRVRSVLYSLLIMINMPDEALLLRKYWSEKTS